MLLNVVLVIARAVERTRGQKLMAIISSNCTTEWSSYYQSTFFPGTRQGLYPVLELFSGISIVPLPDKNKNKNSSCFSFIPFWQSLLFPQHRRKEYSYLSLSSCLLFSPGRELLFSLSSFYQLLSIPKSCSVCIHSIRIYRYY